MPSPLRLLVPAALAFAFAAAAHAQNLFLNPGFETGDFTSWTATGGTVSSNAGDFSEGSKGAILSALAMPTPMSASLMQAIPTVAGKTYIVTFDFSTIAGGTGSLNVQGTAPLSNTFLPAVTAGFQSVSAIFTADSASSTVTVSINAAAGVATARADNFFAGEAVFSKPGKFTGNIKRTTSIAGVTAGKVISSSSMLTVVARIDNSGKMVAIIQPLGQVLQGFVLDSKAFNFFGHQGTATTVGANIKFTASSTIPAGGIGGTPSEPVTVTDSIVLRKVPN